VINSTSIIVRIRKTGGVVWFSGEPLPCDPSGLQFKTQPLLFLPYYYLHLICGFASWAAGLPGLVELRAHLRGLLAGLVPGPAR